MGTYHEREPGIKCGVAHSVMMQGVAAVNLAGVVVVRRWSGCAVRGWPPGVTGVGGVEDCAGQASAGSGRGDSRWRAGARL